MSPLGAWLHHHSRRLGLDVAADATEFTRQWRAEHQRLATFVELRAQLNRRFHELDFAWTPYLTDEYLHGDPAAQQSEARHLHEGSISPVAFLYTGRRDAPTNR